MKYLAVTSAYYYILIAPHILILLPLGHSFPFSKTCIVPTCSVLSEACGLALAFPFRSCHTALTLCCTSAISISHTPLSVSISTGAPYPAGTRRQQASALDMVEAGPISMGTAKMIGFLLAICGNTLIACSLTLQKSAHNSISDRLSDDPCDNNCEPEDPQQNTPNSPQPNDSTDEIASTDSSRSTSNFHFLQNPTWWIGTFLMAAGEVGNFAAFAFAPASLVAPLGAWSVVLSGILAHVFLHEHVSRKNLLGIALCVVGAFLIGTSGPDVSAAEASLDADAVTRLLLRAPFLVFILLTLTATAILMYISHKTTLGEKYIFIYVGVSSLLGGVTVVCAKALSTFLRLTIEGNSQFGNWLPFVLVVVLAAAILLQLRYLNLAMARFGNAQVIPVYYVLFTTCAMSSGVIMYREFDALTLRNIPFFLGICATMSGVFLVSGSAKRHAMQLSEKGDIEKATPPRKRRSTQDYEPMLPISPMSSPRGSQQPGWA